MSLKKTMIATLSILSILVASSAFADTATPTTTTAAPTAKVKVVAKTKKVTTPAKKVVKKVTTPAKKVVKKVTTTTKKATTHKKIKDLKTK